jgi:hypothetical protein
MDNELGGVGVQSFLNLDDVIYEYSTKGFLAGFCELVGQTSKSWVDFIRQFTPYSWNLRSSRIFFPNLASFICALLPTHCIFSQIWMHFTLYDVHPTFMKSTPGIIYHKEVGSEIILIWGNNQ